MLSSLRWSGYLVLAACGGATPAGTNDAPLPSDTSAIDAVVLASCGDGRLDPGEACDDGNTKPGDGCDIFCQVQVGYSCTQASPSVCTVNPRMNPASVIALGGGAGSHLIL